MAPAPTDPAAIPAQPKQLSALWAALGRRQIAELAVPGVVIGLLGGMILGGLSAAADLSLEVALFAGLTFAVLLVIAGPGDELLVACGRLPLSALTPVALYWAVAFPLVRVLHAGMLSLYAGEEVAVPFGWVDFIVFQVLLSVGFAIGYWWLHENFAPRWWFHLRERNPVANFFIRHQLEYAALAERERERKRSVAAAKAGRSR
jgi:hypothetical protein